MSPRSAAHSVRLMPLGELMHAVPAAQGACNQCLRRATTPAPYFDELSPRERQVFMLVLIGHTTRECAGIMHVGAKTAENHRARMMDKLGVRYVVELFRYAWRYGLLPP